MFEKFNFSNKQIRQYYNSSLKDFKIVSESDILEVKFRFSYDALLKLAIAVCAYNNLRVKSRQGHHIELINKLSYFLDDEDIKIIGHEMRNKRNFDLYSGNILISQKEVDEYLGWLKNIFKQARIYLTKNLELFK